MGDDRKLKPIEDDELVAIVAELDIERTAPTTKAIANGADLLEAIVRHRLEALETEGLLYSRAIDPMLLWRV
jgi:hypothetical protein